jgi:hypothetical protein
MGAESEIAVTLLKLDRCQRALSEWSNAKFGNFSHTIRKLTKRLEKL